MPIRSRVAFASIYAALLLFLAACTSRACSVFSRTVQVGPDFRVRVTDRGHPVRGLRLVVGIDSTSLPQHPQNIYAVTDSDGYVRFSNHSPGSFFIGPDHDGGIGDTVVAKVSLGGPPNVTVSLSWPSVHPIEVRSPSGTIRGPDFYPSEQQVPLSLSLLESVSSDVIAEATSDSKGRFKFAGEVSPGVYFLRLNRSGLRGWSGEQMEGLIAIQVSEVAERDAPDLDISWSSCGLTYSQGDTATVLTLPKVCGDITDSIGADVANAEVLLMARYEEGEVMEQTASDRYGRFAFSKSLEGEYRLLIKSPGFKPFLRPIRVESAASGGGCEKPVQVKLQVMLF